MRQLAVHLVAIVRVQVKQLLTRLGVQFRILPDVFVERFQIAESLRPGDGQHLGFNFRDALQAKLVNLAGGEIGGGLVTDGEAIARLSVGQGPDAGIEPSVRRVIVAHEFGELRVGGCDFVLYRAFDCFAQLFPVFLRNGVGKLAQRVGEWALVERVVGNVLRLSWTLSRADTSAACGGRAGRRACVAMAWSSDARDLAQTGQVVFVIFHVAEGGIESERSVSEVNAAKLRRRHLPVFELRGVERFAQAAQHQRVVELFLLGESGDVDGLEARQRVASVFEILGNRLVRKIAQPIVVAIVANLGGKLRAGA